MLLYTPLPINRNGTKLYCNRYCGRGRLFSLIGGKLGLSRKGHSAIRKKALVSLRVFDLF